MKKLCGHNSACKFGETRITRSDKTYIRYIWWCLDCGALGLKDSRGRPNKGEWLISRKEHRAYKENVDADRV